VKGAELIDEYIKGVKKVTDMESISAVTNAAHTALLEIHARALACHCECLGMNAENSFACCVGKSIPYGDSSYYNVMESGSLLTKKVSH